MLKNFNKLNCNKSVKIHYLYSNFEYFPENLGDYSEKYGKRFCIKGVRADETPI